jgi:hypothetical protein
MRKDADLAERVMLEMAKATGSVPLPVHDSFIVPITQASKLEEVMEREISQKRPRFWRRESNRYLKGLPDNGSTIWDGDLGRGRVGDGVFGPSWWSSGLVGGLFTGEMIPEICGDFWRNLRARKSTRSWRKF